MADLSDAGILDYFYCCVEGCPRDTVIPGLAGTFGLNLPQHAIRSDIGHCSDIITALICDC